MDDRVKAIIQREAGLYARRILSAIAEAGLDCRAMPVVFLGGGAGLMKRYLPQGSVPRPIILDDDKLNAQAYERLASQVAGHAGQAANGPFWYDAVFGQSAATAGVGDPGCHPCRAAHKLALSGVMSAGAAGAIPAGPEKDSPNGAAKQLLPTNNFAVAASRER